VPATVSAGSYSPAVTTCDLGQQPAPRPALGLRLGPRVALRLGLRVGLRSACASARLGPRLGWKQARGAWKFSGYRRVDNVFARYYVDTVIVNDSHSRYFEPDPGRRPFAVMLTAARRNQ